VLDDLLAASFDPMVLLDGQRRLLAFNRVADQVFGLASLQGQPAGDMAALQAVLALEPGADGAPVLWDGPRGRTYRVQRATAPSGGELIALRDVTDWKHLSLRLTDLMHIVSHDLRTPLTALKAYAEMLVEQYFGEMSGPQQNALEKLTIGIYGMVALVDNIQAADRFDPVKSSYQTEHKLVDLGTLAQGVINQHELPAEIQKITLELDVASDVPIIRADPLMLDCVLANMVDNALKYSPAGTTVTLRITTVDNHVLVAVRDEGRGIAPEDHERIFERSVRVEQPGHVRVRGSGLGLYVVKSVAQRHGGAVWVESQVGQGSTFFFKLPVRGEPADG
jgi:signal transduction histidine kinase